MPSSVIDDMERKQTLMDMLAAKAPPVGGRSPLVSAGGPELTNKVTRGGSSDFKIPETREQRIKRYLSEAVEYGATPDSTKGFFPIMEFGEFGRQLAKVRSPLDGASLPTIINGNKLTPEQMEDISSYFAELEAQGLPR
jgi:hypothetical protein